MANDALAHAEEAARQGRHEDAMAFLRQAVEAARREEDDEALGQALALARRLPGEDAARLAGELDGAGPAPPAFARLGVLLGLLALVSLVGGRQLVEHVTGPVAPDASYFETSEPIDLDALRPDSIYLVPLGRSTAVDPERIAEQLRTRYRLRVFVLPPVTLPLWAYNPVREQLDVHRVQGVLPSGYGRPGNAPVLIGLTDFDLYDEGRAELRFVIGDAGRYSAVVSSARLGPSLLERIIGRDRTEERVRKMVIRAIGFASFGLRPVDDERSIRRRSIDDAGDVDAMAERRPVP